MPKDRSSPDESTSLSPLRFFYDMDDEIDRLHRRCRSSHIGNGAADNDIDKEGDPNSPFHDSVTTASLSLDDWKSDHSYRSDTLESPIVQHKIPRKRKNDCKSSRLNDSNSSKRRSPTNDKIRKNLLARAVASPVKATKRIVFQGLKNASKLGCHRKHGKTGPQQQTQWQKELGLPADTTEEEALAILLTRELGLLEL